MMTSQGHRRRRDALSAARCPAPAQVNAAVLGYNWPLLVVVANLEVKFVDFFIYIQIKWLWTAGWPRPTLPSPPRCSSRSPVRTKTTRFVGSKVQWAFCNEICTPEGRGRKRRECKFQNKPHRTFDLRNTFCPVLHSIGERSERGGNANFKTKHTEPLTQDYSHPRCWSAPVWSSTTCTCWADRAPPRTGRPCSTATAHSSSSALTQSE